MVGIGLRNLRDRPRPVGFDVTHWRSSGAAHHPGFLVIKLDGQRDLGDGDSQGPHGALDLQIL
jgi:hypothetical protein